MLPGFLKRRPAVRIAAPALALLLFALTAAGVSCGGQEGTAAEQPDTLYQVSTLGALNTGVFEGSEDYATLRQHGDCGIGSFTGLDGEMVALDGVFYQVRTDGVPVQASDGQSAPFAMVTWFQADYHRHSSRRAGLRRPAAVRRRALPRATTTSTPSGWRVSSPP